MIIAETKEALRENIQQWKQQGKTIALVPTMGNLHRGHLSLVKEARNHADITIATIFVNPTQFDKKIDLNAYPRTLNDDIEALKKAHCDLLFMPKAEDMYGDTELFTYVHVPELGDILEGASRKGHFQGVATIVTKLFNLITPDYAVFGEKDFQQLMIIRRMTNELDFNISIIGHPIVREEDGLAMSSRNNYLTDEERQLAPFLQQTLQEIKQKLLANNTHYKQLTEDANKQLASHGFTPDYIKIRRQYDLSAPQDNEKELVILASAWLGKARLIDNIAFDIQ